jgi:hypothetical protein
LNIISIIYTDNFDECLLLYKEIKETLGLDGDEPADDFEEFFELFCVAVPVTLTLSQLATPQFLVLNLHQFRRKQAVVLEVHIIQSGIIRVNLMRDFKYRKLSSF